jgi:hypothetical protein
MVADLRHTAFYRKAAALTANRIPGAARTILLASAQRAGTRENDCSGDSRGAAKDYGSAAGLDAAFDHASDEAKGHASL